MRISDLIEVVLARKWPHRRMFDLLNKYDVIHKFPNAERTYHLRVRLEDLKEKLERAKMRRQTRAFHDKSVNEK